MIFQQDHACGILFFQKELDSTGIEIIIIVVHKTFARLARFIARI